MLRRSVGEMNSEPTSAKKKNSNNNCKTMGTRKKWKMSILIPLSTFWWRQIADILRGSSFLMRSHVKYCHRPSFSHISKLKVEHCRGKVVWIFYTLRFKLLLFFHLVLVDPCVLNKDAITRQGHNMTCIGPSFHKE